MHEEFSLNVATFDPEENINLSNELPFPKRPHISETLLALAKAFEPSATVGFTMREAEAVGLVFQRGTFRERMARRALRVVGFLRHFRKHPQTAFTDMFKDKGRPKLTERCRNIVATAMGVNDPKVVEALRKPVKDMPIPGTSTEVFDAYRQLTTP